MRPSLSAGIVVGVIAVFGAGLALAQLAPSKPTPAANAQSPGAPQRQAGQGTGDSNQRSQRSADEDAIYQGATKFVQAFNAGDAKALAALFTPDGQLVASDGEAVVGREAIEAAFAEMIEAAPESQLEIFVDAIRFIGANTAVETGTTKETSAPGETPEYSHYTAFHVRVGGQWLIAAVRNTPGEIPSHHERLLPLGWLVGDWIDDGGSVVVRTSCRWSDDGNFLLQDIHVQISGRTAMQISQRIGWDPVQQRVRSWAFDSEGGFAEGQWSRLEYSWLIKSTGVRADGQLASATQEIVPAGQTGYVWRVRDRLVGDELQSPLEVKVVRRPPAPAQAAN